MNYTYMCDGATLPDRLRGVDALRVAEERLKGPEWVSSRGSSTSGMLVSVGLVLTLAGIAVFAATLLTQDFTGTYKGFVHPISSTGSVEHALRAIPQISSN